MTLELVSLTYEEMGVRLDLPAGWSIQADEVGDVLICVGDDLEEDGYAPSIVVNRDEPLVDDDLIDQLAEGSLADMERTYPEFELIRSGRHGDRVIRVYEFDQEGRRVRQVQGLISDVGCYVVTATSPMATADLLEATFEAVITSLHFVGD